MTVVAGFVEGGFLSLLLPTSVLTAIVIWWWTAIRRRRRDGRKHDGSS